MGKAFTIRMIFGAYREVNMIMLGKYTTKAGNNYDCQYLPKDKLVQAVGPLPKREGARGVAFEIRAESEQEARQIISVAIESGTLK